MYATKHPLGRRWGAGQKTGQKVDLWANLGRNSKIFSTKRLGRCRSSMWEFKISRKNHSLARKSEKVGDLRYFKGSDLENLSIFWKFLEEKGLRVLVGTRGSLASNRFWGVWENLKVSVRSVCCSRQVSMLWRGFLFWGNASKRPWGPFFSTKKSWFLDEFWGEFKKKVFFLVWNRISGLWKKQSSRAFLT